MKKQKVIKINFPSIILSLVLIGMLTYIIIDGFKTKPQFKENVNHITNNFDSFSRFVTSKLPEIDSALYIHTEQIADQNEQLNELNKLTEILREE
jgi:hypothetical protein